MLENDFKILDIPDPLELMNDGDLTSPDLIISGKVNTKKPESVDDDEDPENPEAKGFRKPATPEKKKSIIIDLSDDEITKSLRKTKGENIDDDDDDQPGGKKKPEVDDDNNDDDPEKKGKKKPDEKNAAFELHYNLMVEAGEWEADESFDGTPESYLAIKEKNNTRQAHGVLDEWVEDAFEKNPDGATMGKKLFNHLKNGGTISDFQELYSPDEFKYEDLESDDDDTAESAAVSLVSNYYAALDWKPELIKRKIESWKKTGTLIDEAKELKEPYQDMVKKSQNQYEIAMAEQAEKRKLKVKETTQNLKKLIAENKSFAGNKLYEDEKQRKKLEQEMFVADEDGVTPFRKKLANALQDPNFILFCQMAIDKNLYKTEAEDLDPEKVQSKVVDKLRTTLENSLLNKDISKKVSDRSTGGQSTATKSKYKFSLDDAIVVQ